MSHKSERLTRKEDISNAFISLFAETFDDVLHLVLKEASSESVKRVEFLHSPNETMILNAIQKIVYSPAFFK